MGVTLDVAVDALVPLAPVAPALPLLLGLLCTAVELEAAAAAAEALAALAAFSFLVSLCSSLTLAIAFDGAEDGIEERAEVGGGEMDTGGMSSMFWREGDKPMMSTSMAGEDGRGSAMGGTRGWAVDEDTTGPGAAKVGVRELVS